MRYESRRDARRETRPIQPPSVLPSDDILLPSGCLRVVFFSATLSPPLPSC